MYGQVTRKGWPSQWLASLRNRFDGVEITILVAIIIITAGIWGFMALAAEVIEGDTHAIDEQLLLALRTNPNDLGDPIGPPWMEEMMRDFTALGGFGILTLITAGVVGYLVLRKKYNGALLMVVTIAGGVIMSLLLKQGFSRPRPDLVPHGSIVLTASFPSGHSMLSAVTYLSLGALLVRLHANRRLKLYLLFLAILMTVLVGISRVYLGVHWPTDVVAGWTAGAVWAVLCWLMARWLQDRGAVEQEMDEPEDEMA